MKKIISIVVIVVVVVGILVYGSIQKSNPSPQEVVKIGLALPLTGNLAFLGEPSRKAAELALKDAGNTKYQYELVFEDQQFNPKIAATAASKLVNVDKVLAIINFGSGTGNAVAPIAEAGKVSHFSLASDPTIAKGEYNFIHWTPPFKEGQLLASEIIKRGYKRVSIIDTNHPGTMAVADAAREALSGSNVQIVSDDLTNMGEKDFRTLINKVKLTRPDIIVLEMFSPEIEIFTRQMRELGMTTPVTSVETFEWSDAPELFEGSWFISDAVTPGFTEKYKAAYGTEPKPGASYTYDLVSFLIKVQENSDTPIEAKDLPQVIQSLGEYNSPVFGNVKIDEDGFFITEASVKIMKDKKGVPVK